MEKRRNVPGLNTAKGANGSHNAPTMDGGTAYGIPARATINTIDGVSADDERVVKKESTRDWWYFATD
ncbi:hypothetical protein quinque_002878 [Culex quinquefasciatus]